MNAGRRSVFNRQSERIRRSVIVPIQMGGSFLISLTSPLVSLASKMMSRRPREEAPKSATRASANADQSMEIKLEKPSEPPGPGRSR